jgi:hypothetical protein
VLGEDGGEQLGRETFAVRDDLILQGRARVPGACDASEQFGECAFGVREFDEKLIARACGQGACDETVAFEMLFERAKRALSVARRSKLYARQQCIRHAAHRGDDHHRTLRAARADDPRHTLKRLCVFDGRAAELHHDCLISQYLSLIRRAGSTHGGDDSKCSIRLTEGEHYKA